jgi:hypothetical protein
MPVKNMGGYPFGMQIPMRMQCMNGDSLSTSHTYLVDTGMAWDIVSDEPEDSEFFNRQDDAVWIGYLDGYFRHYTVNAAVFGNFRMDSLRIYRMDSLHLPAIRNLIGLNFLKRFNVFFDMKNGQIGLQPIKNFQRTVDPLRRRFHLSTYQTPDGRIIVKMVANYKDNYYKTAGIKEGDEIVAVEGIVFKNITGEEKYGLYEKDTLVYDIIRNGQALKITVPVNRNEVKGD